MRQFAVFITLACPSAPAFAFMVPEAFKACASIQVNTERLACYDIAMAQLDGKHADPSMASTPQFLFGSSAKPPATPSAGLQAISAIVSALQLDAYGAAIIELDNGQAWHQISSDGALLLAKGDRVSITRGTLGSFLLSTAGGRSAKVQRLR
jgi:hypothetical protein